MQNHDKRQHAPDSRLLPENAKTSPAPKGAGGGENPDLLLCAAMAYVLFRTTADQKRRVIQALIDALDADDDDSDDTQPRSTMLTAATTITLPIRRVS